MARLTDTHVEQEQLNTLSSTMILTQAAQGDGMEDVALEGLFSAPRIQTPRLSPIASLDSVALAFLEEHGGMEAWDSEIRIPCSASP